jgi:hypothetical protein
MPVCIAGMHRSGTSMVARLLNLCGLDLGPDRDLLPPQRDNPEGFWENRHFVRLNDAILCALGGTWDDPPRRTLSRWGKQPHLNRFSTAVARLLRRFRGREPWGWKDPRNCLTLPFWRRFLPELRVLICVRNPLAVARSLHVREEMLYLASFDLWLTYTRRVLAAVPPEDRIVTHYGRYFTDPHAELRRVSQLLGMEVTAGAVDRACASIRRSLAHHRGTADDLTRAGAPAELVECYRSLCVEAGIPDWSSENHPRCTPPVVSVSC